MKKMFTRKEVKTIIIGLYNGIQDRESFLSCYSPESNKTLAEQFKPNATEKSLIKGTKKEIADMKEVRAKAMMLLRDWK